MNAATIPVELPEPLVHDAAEVAERNGVSVSHWISEALAHQLKNERLTAEFYRRRALGGDGSALLDILDLAPDHAPDPGDEL